MCRYCRTSTTSGTVRGWILGMRVSTTKQDLDRQLDALHQAGIAPERVYLDRKSGATTDRPGLAAARAYARAGDVIVVHTLDRLGRTVRDTLNLIHDLAERGVGVRNLADPIKVDSANPSDPMAQLAVVLLALFGQMERTYALERAAHARAVATAKGRRAGRPAGRPSSTPTSWRTRCTCAIPGTASARSSPRPGSRGRACTGTCRPDPRRSSPRCRTPSSGSRPGTSRCWPSSTSSSARR